MADITKEQREKLLEPLNRLQCKPKRLVQHVLAITEMRDFGLGTDFLDYLAEDLPKMASGALSLPVELALFGVEVAAKKYADQIMAEALVMSDGECVLLRGKRIAPVWQNPNLWHWEVPDRDLPSKSVNVYIGRDNHPKLTARNLVEHELLEQITVGGFRISDPHAVLSIGSIVVDDTPDDSVYCEAVDIGGAPRLPFGLILPHEVEYRLRNGPYNWSRASVTVRFQERWKLPEEARKQLAA